MSAARLTRDEQRSRRDVEKSFGLIFRQQSRAVGWGYLKPTAFTTMDEWFVSIHPVIWTDARRSEVRGLVKPARLDDLVSRIMGHGGLAGEPRSLLARGPFCLVRPMFTADLEHAQGIDAMAEAAAAFRSQVSQAAATLSLADFIGFSSEDTRNGRVSTNMVAALILADRLEEAAALCKQAIAAGQGGAHGRVDAAGAVTGFFDHALAWIREPSRRR